MNVFLSESFIGIDFLGSFEFDPKKYNIENHASTDDAEIFILESYRQAAGLLELWDHQQNPFKRCSIISSGYKLSTEGVNDLSHVSLHSFIGIQEIYTDEKMWTSGTLRLGHIKEDIFFGEPPLRDSQILLFDLNALKKSEAPAKEDSSPIGLTAEEACNLIYFAGNGSTEKMIFFNLDHNRPMADIEITENLINHLIYYYEKGKKNRASANLDKTEYIQEYQVQMEDLDEPLIFRMNTLSNKWWLVLESDRNQPKHIACRPQDYFRAKEGEISRHLLDLI